MDLIKLAGLNLFYLVGQPLIEGELDRLYLEGLLKPSPDLDRLGHGLVRRSLKINGFLRKGDGSSNETLDADRLNPIRRIVAVDSS